MTVPTFGTLVITFAAVFLASNPGGVVATSRVYDVKAFGAVGDGVALDSPAIQAAIDKCSADGGGTVDVPPGSYDVGSLVLKNNVGLDIESGSTLLGSSDPATYLSIDSFTDGVGVKRGEFLIGAFDAKDVEVFGGGVIDGRGPAIVSASSPGAPSCKPFLVRFVGCTEVVVNDVHLVNSAAWTMNFSTCLNCTIENVTIRSKGLANNDGIDLDSTSNVGVTGCDITSDDDSICLKTTSQEPTENIKVSNCTLNSGCATFKTGTESMGDFKHIDVTNCTITGAGLGGVDLFSVDGAHMDDVNISNITMSNVYMPIFIRLGARLKVFHDRDSPLPIGSINNVRITNIHSDSKHGAIFITGVPGKKVTNVILSDISVLLPGGGTTVEALSTLPEDISSYPTPYMFGASIPASAVYLRHVDHVTIKKLSTMFAAPDARPRIAEVDATNISCNM